MNTGTLSTHLTPDGSDLVVQLCHHLFIVRVALLVHHGIPHPLSHTGACGQSVCPNALVHQCIGDGDHRQEMLGGERAREIPTNVVLLINRHGESFSQDGWSDRESRLFANVTYM